jgi:Ca2+-binding EF-hand superfamily protein
MPLIRPNDTTQLSSAFTRFCSNLEDCIRRDGTADTEGFFASGITSNFNNYASSYSADSIYANLNERLNTEDYSGYPNGAINNLSRRVTAGLFSPVLTNMKSTILCAFELTNRGQMNRINKQQLYTFLFCLGFPVGLISKIILNGNVGGVRNGVLTHKQFATALLIAIASGSRRDDLKKGFLGNENVGSIWEHRFFTICLLCQKVGGQNLFNKFVNCTDQKELAQSVYAQVDITTFTKQLLCYGFTINDRVYRVNTINLFQITFAEQRGQRRTGQTLSRNAVDTTNLSSSTALPSASNTPRNSEVRSSVSSEQSRPITTPTRSTATSPVRDEPLQETIGVEFEVVRPKEVSYREFVNSVVKKFRENGLDVQAEGYNHNTRNYWKLVPDASISAQTR